MEYTQNYQLPLWDKEDSVLRTDFNENNQKIDAAIAAVAASVSNLIVTGTYVGTTSGSSTEKQTIELGFQPRFLFIRDTTYKGSTTVSDDWTPQQLAFAVPGHGSYVKGSTEVVSITPTGFTVGGVGSLYNHQNCTYAYLAIR